MMKLSQLLEQIEYTCVQGGLDKEIKSVVYDSRKVTPDSLFLCIKGAVSDGHKYAKEVVEKGATVLVVQDEVEVRTWKRQRGFPKKRKEIWDSVLLSIWRIQTIRISASVSGEKMYRKFIL